MHGIQVWAKNNGLKFEFSNLVVLLHRIVAYSTLPDVSTPIKLPQQ